VPQDSTNDRRLLDERDEAQPAATAWTVQHIEPERACHQHAGSGGWGAWALVAGSAPDGRHVLFTVWAAGAGLSESRIAVLDLQTGTHRTLFTGAMPRYAAGHLVYYAGGVYQMVPFDPATQRALSEPAPVLPDALALLPQGTAAKPFSLAAHGSVAYVARPARRGASDAGEGPHRR
jgi:hypothetical protein